MLYDLTRRGGARGPALVPQPEHLPTAAGRRHASAACRLPFEPQAQLDTAYDLLREVMGEYRVDQGRVYLAGISMGGYGALAMAVAHPGVFAAVVPVCGGGDPRGLKAIARTPMWLLHAEQDPVVPVQASRDSVQAVRAAGGTARYTECPRGTFFFPDAHHSWTTAYADPELRAWLFSQSRGGPAG